MLLENQIPQTKTLQVVVIWDEWGNLPPMERATVIHEAYAKLKRARGLTITLAMGLTSDAAFTMGLLPYSIVTTRRPGDKASNDALAKAMDAADGIKMQIGSSKQLRFATLEQAENAYRYLSQQIPGPYWAIVQEQRTGE